MSPDPDAEPVVNVSDETPDANKPSVAPPSPTPSMPGLGGALGDLGERLDKIIEEGVVADDRIAERLAGKNFGQFAREQIVESAPKMAPIELIRAGRRAVRLVAILSVLTAIDALTGDGWWVQWPAIVAAVMIGISFARGVWRTGVLASGLVLVDMALGGEWWSHWIAIGAAALVALKYVSSIRR